MTQSAHESTAELRRSREIAVPVVMLATVAWSIGPLLVRGMHVSGYTTAFYRMWVGALMMIVMARVLGRPLTWPVFKRVMLPGTFFGASMTMGFQAVHATSIANATLIGSLTPALLLLGVNRFVGERSDPKRVPFALLAIGGLVVLVLSGASKDGAAITGDIWALANLMCFTSYFVILKRLRNDNVDGWSFLAGAFLMGAIVITPVCFLVSDDMGGLVASDWWRIIGMGVGPGIVGHGLITWASRHLPVTTTSLLTLGSPVLTCIGAWIFFDQNLVFGQLIGASMVVGGLVGSVWDRRSDPVLASEHA